MTAMADVARFYRDRPVQFVRTFIGAEPDATQQSILTSVAENKMTSVRSGHGIGKTATLSWLICWYLLTRPFARIPCTAPTQPTLRDVLWTELAKWIRQSRFLSAQLTWTSERVGVKGHEKEWYAVARTATKPEALQGFHADHLLFVIDEASGVDDRIFEPVLGSLSTPDSRLVMCANPTQLSGFFYLSHTEKRASYNCIRADGRKSGRVAREFIDDIIAQFGEDSNAFRVRVAGEFPNAADDTFVPLSLVEDAISDAPPPEHPALIDIAADVARFGNDRTVIGVKLDDHVRLVRKISGQDTMRTASEIAALGVRLVEQYGYDGIIPVKIDDSGVGGGVTDRLRQMRQEEPDRYRWMFVVPVLFGQHIDNRHYDDTTTYMMATVRDLLAKGELVLPNDRDLVAQLAARKYSMTPRSRVRVESKEAMKKRGLASPDEADCLCMLCVPVDRDKAKRRSRLN